MTRQENTDGNTGGDTQGNEANGSGNAPTVSKAEYDALLTKYQNTEAEREHLKRTNQEYSKLGDPDALKGKLEDYTNMRKKSAGDPDEINALVSEEVSKIEDGYKSKIGEVTEQRDQYFSELKELKVVDKAMQLASNFNEDALPLVRKLVGERGDIVDGEVVFYKEGTIGTDSPVIERSSESPDKNMSVAEFMKTLESRYPSLVKAQSKPGTMRGNEKTSSVNTNGLTVDQWRQMSKEQKAELKPDVRKRLALASAKAG